MNLHALANRAITTLNPNVTGSILTSTGYTTASTGARTPTFTRTDGVKIQEQPLSANDLEHLDSLNIQKVTRAAYVNGQVNGVNRGTGQGGDFLYFNGAWWLVTIVFEPFDQAGWCRVGLTAQTVAPV